MKNVFNFKLRFIVWLSACSNRRNMGHGSNRETFLAPSSFAEQYSPWPTKRSAPRTARSKWHSNTSLISHFRDSLVGFWWTGLSLEADKCGDSLLTQAPVTSSHLLSLLVPWSVLGHAHGPSPYHEGAPWPAARVWTTSNFMTFCCTHRLCSSTHKCKPANYISITPAKQTSPLHPQLSFWDDCKRKTKPCGSCCSCHLMPNW